MRSRLGNIITLILYVMGEFNGGRASRKNGVYGGKD